MIVHLAAMNRHSDSQVIYKTNLRLVNQLIAAMEAEKVTPHVLFSSSSQEERDKNMDVPSVKGGSYWNSGLNIEEPLLQEWLFQMFMARLVA